MTTNERMHVKLLLSFDIRSGQENGYRRFVIEALLPEAQALGLTPADVWQTAYGDYPERLVGFAAESLDELQRIRASDEWRSLRNRLERFTQNLNERAVQLRGGFQW